MDEHNQSELRHGFQDGNYANAYETEDYQTFLDNLPKGKPYGRYFYRIGCLLGFFSSYELHEVPDDWQERVRIARNNYKDFV